ncbi:MAG: NUDIX domain-containing protein [Actinomycetes bacterium]
MGDNRVQAVGAVVHDARGRLLLVLRGREPAAGLWSIPGGKVEPGESHQEAVCREVLEETGLRVEVLVPVGVVERPTAEGGIFEIHDYTARLLSDPGDAVAADDAEAVGWFTADQVRALGCVPGLVTALDAWGLLGP